MTNQQKILASPALSRRVHDMAYTKLFHSILTSTIWTEDDKTRIVWITLMACADKNGEIQASIPGLARIAGVDVEACQLAINKFLSPDLHSRTKDDEGRRIQEIDGGWEMLNFLKYRDMASKEDNRIMESKRKARWRAKKARNEHNVHGVSTVCPRIPSEYASDSVLPEGGSKGETEKPNEEPKTILNHPPLKGCQEHFRKCSDYTNEQVRVAFLQFEASTCDGSWMWGKRAVTDWRAAMESKMSENLSRLPQGNKKEENPDRKLTEAEKDQKMLLEAIQ